jgi:hypothetical protein
MATKNDIKCTCCGKETSERNFYISKSFIYKATSHLPVCKTCLGSIYDKYYNKYQDYKLALYYMCRAVGICFNLGSYNAVLQEIDNGKTTNVWQIYMTKLNSLGGKNGAGDDFDSSDSIDVKEEKLNAIKNEGLNIDDEILSRWGNLPISDLEFLEYNYNQWVTRHQCETRAEEILYEEICQMQLDIKKTRETGGDVMKKVEALQKLMSSANIRPLDQNALSVNENVMMWGTTVATVEKEEPCEYFEEYKRKQYEDFMGYRKYFNDWVLRPLKNLLSGSKDFNITLDEKDIELTDDETGEENG